MATFTGTIIRVNPPRQTQNGYLYYEFVMQDDGTQYPQKVVLSVRNDKPGVQFMQVGTRCTATFFFSANDQGERAWNNLNCTRIEPLQVTNGGTIAPQQGLNQQPMVAPQQQPMLAPQQQPMLAPQQQPMQQAPVQQQVYQQQATVPFQQQAPQQAPQPQQQQNGAAPAAAQPLQSTQAPW